MSDSLSLRRLIGVFAAFSFTLALTISGGFASRASAATSTTAWQNGAFQMNTGGVVSRSDVVLGSPNTSATQSLPIGNGSLGAATWAANGFTAQLNRSDTMPNRLSPGQLSIPGLSAMTTASNFSGYLDLYNGVLHESGGGITMNAWIPAAKDEVVVDVSGANPNTQQTATLSLWSGRSPTASTSGTYASLAQTWVDNSQNGYSGSTFGAMATITASGQNVASSVVNSTEVQVSFTPNSDGSFRVILASPTWTGGNPESTAQSLIGTDTTAASSSLLATQSSWWNNYWANSGLIEMNSADGTAQYLENLRTLYLYFAASTFKTGAYPGSQAGVADLFEYNQDAQDWYPAGYWLWNLRAEIAANISSGNFALNTPIFDMYLNDLPAIESWTSAQMNGTAGACVPETMRFNGNGYYNGGNNTQNASCATASSPSYNALTLTSGAEIALWVWQQYEDTGSASFLQKYYPIMQQSATFLLDIQSKGSDGFLHASANAHETQWAVSDPTTDIAASQALFPATVQAAAILNTDQTLAGQLRTAEGELEPYARAGETSQTTLLNSQPTSASAVASLDAQGTDVIADSYQPSATLHNGENIGLEPVWPYGVIGDATTVNGDNLTALADRTYNNRPGTNNADWSMDAIDAARLDMPSAVQSDLVALTEGYQTHISGLGALSSSAWNDPYLEQSATVATTLDEALATDYDGTLRFAPAWPSTWDASGTVAIQGGSKVAVQMESGTLATAAITAGSTITMAVSNPWPGSQAEVVNGSTGATVVSPTTAASFSLPVTAGTSYLVEQPSNPTTSMTYAQVTGTQPSVYKTIGSVQIGLPQATAYANLAASYNDVGITADNNTNPGNWDGGGASFSETALTNVGAGPGAGITTGGVTYVMPNLAAGTADNTVAEGQTIDMPGSGSSLGFLLSASYGPASGSGTITYSDGSTESYTLNAPDWWSTTAPTGGTVAGNSAYQNRQGNTMYSHTADIFAESVSLTAGKTVASVTLPPGGALAAGTPAIHVFDVAFGGASLSSSSNNIGITADNNTNPGNWDGGGASFSETALTSAGAGPGAGISTGGLTYTFPNTSPGTADNTVVQDQTIALSGSGTHIGFLLSASYGPATGTATLTYTDGTTQSLALNAPDWFSTTAPTGGTVAVNSTYQNRQGNSTYSHTADIFAETFTLAAGKAVSTVTLPAGGPLAAGTPAIHVFAVSVG